MSNDKISDVGINIAEKAAVIWNVAGGKGDDCGGDAAAECGSDCGTGGWQAAWVPEKPGQDIKMQSNKFGKIVF